MKTTFTIQTEEAEVQQLLDALRVLLLHMNGKQVEIAVSTLPSNNLLHADSELNLSIGQSAEVTFAPEDVIHISNLFEAENFEAVSAFIEKREQK